MYVRAWLVSADRQDWSLPTTQTIVFKHEARPTNISTSSRVTVLLLCGLRQMEKGVKFGHRADRFSWWAQSEGERKPIGGVASYLPTWNFT